MHGCYPPTDAKRRSNQRPTMLREGVEKLAKLHQAALGNEPKRIAFRRKPSYSRPALGS